MSPPLSLLTLPLELRLKIYSYILTNPAPLPPTRTQKPLLGRKTRLWLPQPQLLTVCRQLRAEAMPVHLANTHNDHIRFAAFYCNPSETHVRRIPRVLRARVKELISEYVGFMAVRRLVEDGVLWFPALEVVTLRVADAKLELVEAAGDKHGMEKCTRAELDMLPLAAAAAAGDLVGLGFGNDRDTGFVWRSRASRGMGERTVRIRIHVLDWTEHNYTQGGNGNDGDKLRYSLTLTIGRNIRKSVSFKVCCEAHLVAQQKPCLLYRGLGDHTMAYGSFPRDEFRGMLNAARLEADEGGKF